MGATYVRTDRDGPVLRVTVDRAERYNSFVPSLLEELEATFGEAAEGHTVRSVILRTAGEPFSTGGDVQAMYDHQDDLAAYADRLVGNLNAVIRRMLAIPIPIVVAVDGVVTGGAAGLLLGSDFVYMDPEATVTPYYAEVGFGPDGGWTALMPAIIGRRRTAEVLAANRPVSSEEAVEWGLASAVTADVEDRARTAAETVADHPPGAVRHAMELLGPDPDSVAAALERERRRFVEQVQSDEAVAGMRTFLGD